MKNKGITLICAIVATMMMSHYCFSQSVGAGRALIDEAVMKVKPALVRIIVATVEYYQGREVKAEASGSGVIISPDGYVVTNHHVAGDAKRIICTLSTKDEVDADLVATDPLTDIAVIKLRDRGEAYPYAEFGDSSELKVGDAIMAMGSPLSLSQSVTLGIVSNTEMVLPSYIQRYGGFTLEGEDVGTMVRWIGHDAEISPGNSGGPLVNIKGEIVGINEISLGLSGAIPGNLAKLVSTELIKHKKVSRSWFGISLQPLLKSFTENRGVLISHVMPDSPAEKAGMKNGDILLSIGDNDILVRYAEQMPPMNLMMSSFPINQEIEAKVLRDSAIITLKITPMERPEAKHKPRELKAWGMCGNNISLIETKQQKRANQDGVRIASVRPGGPCGEAKPSLQVGDIILELNNNKIKNIDQLVEATAAITKRKTKPTPALVLFDRNSEIMMTVVKLGIPEPNSPDREARKAWLPVYTQPLTRDLAEALGISDATGVRVTQILPISGDKPNLKVGDILIELDGEAIPASNPEDNEVLDEMIRQYKIGSIVEFLLLRGKEKLTIKVKLGQSPPASREMLSYRDDNFEFTVRDLAFEDKVELKESSAMTGVYVEEANSGGWAALGGLMAGDVIIEINGNKVSNISDVKQIMAQIARTKPKYVIMKVKGFTEEKFVEMETDWTNSK